MNIGAAIEEIRKQKNISQKELANLSNITQSYLSLIENNKKEPNLKILKKISEGLNVPLPFLFLFSISDEDVAENKKETFTIVMPLVKQLIGQYIKD